MNFHVSIVSSRRKEFAVFPHEYSNGLILTSSFFEECFREFIIMHIYSVMIMVVTLVVVSVVVVVEVVFVVVVETVVVVVVVAQGGDDIITLNVTQYSAD